MVPEFFTSGFNSGEWFLYLSVKVSALKNGSLIYYEKFQQWRMVPGFINEGFSIG
jgi:hypothetical protein